MKHIAGRPRASVTGMIFLLLFSGEIWHGQHSSLWLREAVAQTPQPGTTSGTPVYKPPVRGAPTSRVGGGSRGLGDQLPMLIAVVPDHTGLTVHEQPVLYWYVSKATTAPVEVTLVDPQSPKPLLALLLQPPLAPGMQRVRLAEHGVRLATGVTYQWLVALIRNPNQRSEVIITGGTIQRVPMPAALHATMAQPDQMARTRQYAEAGLWYDALATISALIEAAPRDTALRQQRAGLLEQVGLAEVAAYDRQGG
jgi:Domain of Unknown Function (DUF928)